MDRMTDLIKKHKIMVLPLLLLSFYILGYLFLVISYCFPVDVIREHIRQDLYSVVSVGEWIPGHDDTVPDYYTDSLMLLEAEYATEDTAFIASIKSPRALQPESNFVYETYINYNENNGFTFYEYDYFRYWHGYLIILKPLLYLFSLGTVKYLTVLLQFILLFSFVYYVMRSGYSFWYSVPMLAAYMFMNPITLGLSFQYNTVFSLTVLSLVILFADHTKKKIVREFPAAFFFIIGMVTSYFDLMTYPVLTFGIPALYFFLLYLENDKKYHIRYVTLLVSWVAGYGGMWMGKWMISAALLGKDAFNDIKSSISVRSGFDASETFSGDYVSYFEVLRRNLSVQAVYGLLILLVAAVVLLYGIVRRNCRMDKSDRSFLIICLITGCLPFVWYFLLPNHSWIHYWFTYRTLAVSVCSIMMISLASLDNTRS